MRWLYPCLCLAGCTSYGYGASQTSMVGRASNSTATADLTVEQRSVEVTMFATLGRVLLFGEGGLSAFTVRERRGGDAMEPDDIGLGDRSAIGGGYMLPLDRVTVTPFASYSISLANSALTGTSEGDDLLESTLYGGPGAGVEVLLRRDGVTPYVRAGVERLRGAVLPGLFDATGGDAGTAFTATAVMFTVGLRGEMYHQ